MIKQGGIFVIENIIILILGFILLVKGADFLVNGASSIAKKLKIPTLVIGLTIVAVGTSMPELVVSTFSAIEGHSDIAMGNIVGSNLSNLLFILGVCAIMKPLEFKKQTKFIENFIAIFATILLFAFSIDNTISRIEGIIFLLCCVGFIGYNIFMALKHRENNLEETEELKILPIWKACLYVVIGIIALKFGGDFVVTGASAIASLIGISERIISLTIVAFSTSLPELITSVTATKRGEVDLGIGNILGSQILNIFLIIGLSSVITPITYEVSYNKDMIILLASSILFAIYPFIGEKDKMTKREGIIFLGIYAYYLVQLVCA